MKIRDTILLILIIAILVNSAIIVSFASGKIQKISDVSTGTSSEVLKDNAGEDLKNVAIALRESLDKDMKYNYDMVKQWAKMPVIVNTAKAAQSKTKEELYEMWSAEATRAYDDGEATGDGNPGNDLNPQASKYLISLSGDTYPEIFITDSRGYAIAASGATGDFDQGPDDWRIFLEDETPVFKKHKPEQGGEGWYRAANEASDGFYISDLEYDESADTWGLELVSQIRDPDTDAYLGELKAVFNYGKFMESFVNIDELGIEEVKVVNMDGNVLGESSKPGVGSEENEVASDMLMADVKTGKTSGVIVDIDADEDYEELTAWVRSKDKNAYIIAASKEMGEINEPIEEFTQLLTSDISSVGKELQRSILTIAIIVGLVTLGLAFVVINYKISTPINKLTQVSEKLTQGEIKGLEVDVSSNDEIGHLGEGLKGVLAAFNLLNDQIKKKK